MPFRLTVRRERLLLAAILLLGAGLRLWGITWGLHNADVSRRPHPDEWVVYWLFGWFGTTSTLNPCPSYPHQCFFDWGMAYPYLAYAVHQLLAPLSVALPASFYGPRADRTFVNAVLAGRLTAAALSTLTVWLVYRVGRRAYGGPEALIGALVAAISGLLFQLAHFATPDSATLCFMTVVLLLCVGVAQSASRRFVLVAGAAIGLSAGSEFHMVLLFVPLAVAWWLRGDRHIGDLAGAAVLAGAVFLAVNPYIVIDGAGFWNALQHTLRIRTVDSTAQYDNRWAPYAPAILYVLRYPLGYGAGFLLAAWMIGGLLRAVWVRSPADVVLLSWIVPYFILVTAEPAKFMRYSAPLLVPLAILAGRAARELGAVPVRRLRLAVPVMALIVVLYTGVYDLAYAGMFASTDPRQTAGAWVVAHSRPGQGVGFEVIPDGLLNLPYFLPENTKYCFSEFRANRLRGTRFVLLDSYTPEEQNAAARALLVRFKYSLTRQTSFKLVDVIHLVPTFLGLDFPIDASPHDWRYPSHEIEIYEGTTAGGPSPYCYNSIATATRALYVRH